MKSSMEGRFKRTARVKHDVKPEQPAQQYRSGSRYRDNQIREAMEAEAKQKAALKAAAEAEAMRAKLAAEQAEEAEHETEEAADEAVYAAKETEEAVEEAAEDTVEEAAEDTVEEAEFTAEEVAEEDAVVDEAANEAADVKEDAAEDSSAEETEEADDSDELEEDDYLDDPDDGEEEGDFLDDPDEVDEEDYLDDPDDEAFDEGAEEAAQEAAEQADEQETAKEAAAAQEAETEAQTEAAAVPCGSRYADKQKAAQQAAQQENKEPVEKQPFTFSGWWSSYVSNLKAKKIGAVTGTCAAAAVVAAYIGGAVYFNKHFYPKTEIYGIVCGNATEQTLTDAIRSKVGEYVLQVDGREGKSEMITAEQIGLAYTEDDGLKQALKAQQSFLWPFKLLAKTHVDAEVGTHFDEEKAEAVVRSLDMMQRSNQVRPAVAKIGDNGALYEVVPEVEGTTLKTQSTVATILEALGKGADKVDLDASKCYLEPEIRSDSPALNEIVDAKNAVLGADITYTFGDEIEKVDTKSLIVQDADGSYHYSEEKIWNYVAELADKYDTFGQVHTFHTSIGTTVELYGGDYGWAINQADTAQALLEDCIAKKTETIEPIYAYSAKSHGVDDIGGTYVEICISLQEMWCYQDYVLQVDTPVVTGNPSKGNATPSNGVWAIDAMMRDYTLVGEGYRSPVDYWMPFNGNVGIHDLQTRSAFGGTIYQYAGSHGCVNTPLDAVSMIYSIVSIGTPVIVYD